VIAAVLSLQLGAFAVVLQTVASGISALPLGTFLAFMLPIHLAIGIVEGVVTAAVISFVRAARPGVLPTAVRSGHAVHGMASAFLVVALVLGGVGAWFASKNPDGLEWSVARVTGAREPDSPQTGLEAALGRLQQRTALLPGYGFRHETASVAGRNQAPSAITHGGGSDRLGKSLAGVVGGSITLALALLVGFALKLRSGWR
jgi:cobalt/nickel transport system permease protein